MSHNLLLATLVAPSAIGWASFRIAHAQMRRTVWAEGDRAVREMRDAALVRAERGNGWRP